MERGGEYPYANLMRDPIDHSTPSLMYALVHQSQLTSTHIDIKGWVGAHDEEPDDSIFLQEYLQNNYDCFQGCVKVRDVNNANPRQHSWMCSRQPRGHWLSVYDVSVVFATNPFGMFPTHLFLPHRESANTAPAAPALSSRKFRLVRDISLRFFTSFR